MTGLIIKNTGSDYLVRTDNGATVVCKVKGTFRIKGIKSTSPVTVGDRVDFDETGYITTLHNRKNYIVRRPTNLSKQLHIIAANLDQAMLVVTIKNPVTSTIFIDRFLATAEAYRIPTVLVFNKIDLLDAAETKTLSTLIALYEQIGYQCLQIVASRGDGMGMLKKELAGKVTLLSGNSGVGKSTIINQVMPDGTAKTGEISMSHLTGMHTTTFSEMYEVATDTFIIDTPGIKGFGMVNMAEDEISHFFPDIFKISKACRFGNCSHRHEPGCAVLKAVEENDIALSRYESYLSILNDFNEGKYR
ncbi:MAG: ribosome small subunit-dependent GTPase A [Sphingobacteriia bacterium]|jgi:ribosome biogenesis GTPase / thiamine phosphate phosphatase|nr:ribosome small subunit-dependent GTPase A [Paludibacteraceae bacterium]NCA78788.1 ribosome small subunit-dependent GTPase A [Sphingobacteriia bacterium]